MTPRSFPVLLAAVVAAGGSLLAAPAAAPAHAARPAALLVIPRPASGPGAGYFHVRVGPGRSAGAGAIVLRNTSRRSVRVALAAVAGRTLDSLGSGYAPPGTPATGAAAWLRLGPRTVVVPARRTVAVPVGIHVPRGAGPGDHLAGVSIEQLSVDPQSSPRAGVSIASVSRYAIGVEVSVPGRREAAIRFTGATIERQPSGIEFALLASNPGNEILKGVRGGVRISEGNEVVIARAIPPGTFVAGSTIALPVPDPGLVPAEGSRFRVQAWLRYGSRIARLDTPVTFGRRETAVQNLYRKPQPASPGGGPNWLQLGLFGAVALYAAFITAVLARRRHSDAAAK